VSGHKLDIPVNRLANAPHVSSAEPQEFFCLAVLHQIDILEAVFHGERLVYFSVYNTAFQIKLAQLFFDVLKQVPHQQDVHLSDVLHLDSIDAIDFCDQAFRVFALVTVSVLYVAFTQMVKVAWQSFDKDCLLTLVHCLYQKSLVS